MQQTALLIAALAATALATVVPTVELEAGVYMPMAGLGTWQYNNSVAGQAVFDALEMGYTHFDTALVYGNQVGIGAALQKTTRARDTFFITSKIPGGLNFSAATDSANTVLSQLGVDYVDLLLVHYPATWTGEGGKAMRQEGWKALEAFKAAGKARAIGVSHFCKTHIDDILEINTTQIALNQVEFHIGIGTNVQATDYRQYDKEAGITYMSFSTLCGPCGTKELINGTLVTSIGAKYGKSGPQVSLKWAVQQGIPVIPKTDNKKHMASNIDLFSWTLSDDDMAALSAHTTPPAAGGGTAHPGESGDCYIE